MDSENDAGCTYKYN